MDLDTNSRSNGDPSATDSDEYVSATDDDTAIMRHYYKECDSAGKISSSEEESECSESDEDSSSAAGHYSALKYKVELSLSSSTRCSKQVYSAIKHSVARIIRRCSSESAEISEKVGRWGNVFLNISSNDHYAFEEAKKTVARVAEPHVVLFTGSKENQYVSTLHFQKSVRDIQAKTSTYIKINNSSLTTSTIGIYGAERNRKKAKEEVEAHLLRVLCEGTDCFEVHLKRERPGLMKHLVERYGTDVSGIIDTIPGIAATKLIPRDQVLTLFATEAGYQSFLLSLKDYRPAGIVTQQAETLSVMECSNQCCVCLESHDTKQANTFFYRLEYCGHVYCKECIELQLQPSSITFPVTCAAEGCERELVWKDFSTLFKHKVKKLCDITTTSLKSYVARNSDKVHNCTTPDCDMVYLISEEGKRFTCKSCGANICTRCHSTWHPGFDTCLAYKTRDSTNLSQWIKGDPKRRKKCPKCSVPIEKSEGCQHMTCTQCGSHICWLCLKFFSSSSACYDHLTACHGGCF